MGKSLGIRRPRPGVIEEEHRELLVGTMDGLHLPELLESLLGRGLVVVARWHKRMTVNPTVVASIPTRENLCHSIRISQKIRQKVVKHQEMY